MSCQSNSSNNNGGGNSDEPPRRNENNGRRPRQLPPPPQLQASVILDEYPSVIHAALAIINGTARTRAGGATIGRKSHLTEAIAKGPHRMRSSRNNDYAASCY